MALILEFTQGDPALFRAAGAMNSELLQDPDAVKAQRVMGAMLKMTKIDVAALERAYAGQGGGSA